jgi:hypothetical protein
MRITVPFLLSTRRPSSARSPHRTGHPRSRLALRIMSGFPRIDSVTEAVFVSEHVWKPSLPLILYAAFSALSSEMRGICAMSRTRTRTWGS